MNTQTSLILDAARPRGQDDTEPEVAIALREIENDAAAQAWLHQRRRDDASIGEALRSIDPPADFEQNLQRAMQSSKRVQTMPRRWFIPASAAAAAAVIGGLYWRSTQGLTSRELAERVADISARGVTLSLMSMNKDEVVKWLADARAPRAQSFPTKLDAVGRKGCHVYNIEGHQVSLECFIIAGTMRELHLFTIPSASLKDAIKEADGTRFEALGSQTLATWARDTHMMFLLSRESIEDTQALLS